MSSLFLQIHTLTSYPAALLNRDDLGFAKRLSYGGAERTRISSQCLKRHWRTFAGEFALDAVDAPKTVRSRVTFERLIVEPLLAEGHDAERVRAVVGALRDVVLDAKEKAEVPDAAPKKGAKRKAPLAGGGGDAPDEGDGDGATAAVETKQVTVLGQPEVDYLLVLAREAALAGAAGGKKELQKWLGKERLENLRTLTMGGGLGAAMFGRMVTSDILARCDAAVHVAHAFTVHENEQTTDYFAAIDDLVKESGEQGSGHIGNVELTSGLYYGYVVIDVPLLVSNLTGVKPSAWGDADRALAAEIIERFIQLVATVSPGAKLGSTAPYAYAHAVIVEAGASQPRTLASAFEEPVSTRSGPLLGQTYRSLGRRVLEFDGMYGKRVDRWHAAIGLPAEVGFGSENVGSVAALASRAADRVRSGR